MAAEPSPVEAAGAATVEPRVLASLGLTSFAGFLGIGVFAPFLAVMADDLGVSVGLLGQAATVALLATGLSGLVIGPLADHFGHRRAMLAGLALVIVNSLGVALATSFALVLGMRAFAGVGFAATGVATAAVAVRYLGDTRRRAISLITGASMLSSLVGVPLLTTIGSVTSWRGAYVCVGVVGLIATVILWLGFRPDGRMSARPFRARDVLAAYARLLSERHMPLLIASTAFQIFSIVGILTYAGAFLVDELGFSLREVGYAFMVQGGGAFLGSFAGGGRLGRFNLRLFYTLMMVLMGLLILVIFSVPSGPYLTMLLLFGTGLTQIAGWVCLATILANETPVGQATTMVLSRAVLGLGGALGAAAGGLLLELSGYPALGVLYLLAALSAAALVWARPRQVFSLET